jgi:hypothetical protein
MIIKISTNYDETLARQAPGGILAWKDAEFVINQESAYCDAWVIHEGLSRRESTQCPADRVFFLSCEPPEIKTYGAGWLSPFTSVITCHRDLRHPRIVQGQTALPWHVCRSYDQLAGQDFPDKDADLSVICSDKATIEGHRRRLRFVEGLLRQTPMPRFGRGFNALSDKWDGLAPYRYSIAIENSQHDHYWTEKIADCFLAGTVPIYWGAPNIRDYFPAEAMIVLDTLDPREAARIIKAEATKEGYEKRLPALREAKRRVLEDYNLLALAYRLATEGKASASRLKVSLAPEPRSRAYRIYCKLRRLLG